MARGMKNSIVALVVLFFAAWTTSRAEEKETSDPVFKSLGEAIEEVVVYMAKAQFADSEPAGFSIGVEDHGAMPGENDLGPLPSEMRTRLAKRLPTLWKNFVELEQVEFIPWRRPGTKIPDELLPKVPNDAKGKPICFLKITGLRFLDDRTIQVSWKCTGGGPGGNGGTKSLTKVGNEWRILEIRPYFFD